jgi:hypothetical protein
MFVLTTLVYPVVLALLCLGAGLLVDRASGGVVAAMLIPSVGMAALIVLSQLTTYVVALAPATPYLLAAVAIAGFVLGWSRLLLLAAAWRASRWRLLTPPLVYALALAPVLLAGRPTFSSYMALADSAVHMLGADFLIRHGQDYSHLDLRNSYGAFVHAYYDTSYPSGADTLLGGSAFLLGLPLMWAFQPFNAFALATASGPAWILARRVGLDGVWAALATLTIVLPALVYAYELIGSVKEIVALPLILTLGALVVTYRRWLWRGARAAIPFALVIAAGVGALGVAFGAWALVATLTLALAAGARLLPARRGARAPGARALSGLLALGALVLLVGAWPTWVNLSGSVHVAQAIASTSNPGNLRMPLHPSQLLGVWLVGSYKALPTGVWLTLTSLSIAIVLVLALVGVGNMVRSGWYSLAGWLALSIVLWLALSASASTWAQAKTLMLTSPVVMVMAWAGVARLRGSSLRIAATLVAVLLVGGVVVSDALQYHQSNLAPTARYEELASLNKRFAGRGPALLTDFDEYSLYELRDLDVGGPDFVYPPPALAAAAGGYGRPVELDRIAPATLLAYPLILARRDPSAVRPAAAYRLLWEGVYYQVWARRPRAPAALVHVALSGSRRARCGKLARVVSFARAHEGRLVGSRAPELVPVPLARTIRPSGWSLARPGIEMGRAGTLHASFRLPHGGAWELWLKGELMREVHVAIDAHPLGSLGAQLDGNSLVPNTLSPLRATLSAGWHTLTLTRGAADLAPGDGGAAVLAAIFLAPATSEGRPSLQVVSLGAWRTLCAPALQWTEVLPKR